MESITKTKSCLPTISETQTINRNVINNGDIDRKKDGKINTYKCSTPGKSFQTLVQILTIIMQWLDCVDHEIFRPTQLHFGQG